jgi:hypothetical protein
MSLAEKAIRYTLSNHTRPAALYRRKGEMMEFERDHNGRIIVDDLIVDPHTQNWIIARIGDDYFALYFTDMVTDAKDAPCQFYCRGEAVKVNPYNGKIPASWDKVEEWSYIFYGCAPRDGFKVSLGREISAAELAEVRKQYKISDDDITDHTFVCHAGGLYGLDITYDAIQVRTQGGVSAITLERELSEAGIEAYSGSPGRVNIRVKKAAKGGMASSEAKIEAARENGKRGGRPRKEL